MVEEGERRGNEVSDEKGTSLGKRRGELKLGRIRLKGRVTEREPKEDLKKKKYARKKENMGREMKKART